MHDVDSDELVVVDVVGWERRGEGDRVEVGVEDADHYFDAGVEDDVSSAVISALVMGLEEIT